MDPNGSTAPHVVDRSQQNTLIIVMSIFTALASSVVLLRLYVRRRLLGRFGIDDIAIFCAWVSSLAFLGAVSASIHFGIGLHLMDLNPDYRWPSAKSILAFVVIYHTTITLIKLAILLLYYCMTKGYPGKFVLFVKWTIALIVGFWIATMIIVFAKCVPTVDATCAAEADFFTSTNIFTVITDVWILALPIYLVWNIKRPRAERLGVLLIFAAGFIATAASCVRTYTIGKYTFSTDPFWDAVPITIWSFVEINLGIICASAPALKSLFARKEQPKELDSSTTCPTLRFESTDGTIGEA